MHALVFAGGSVSVFFSLLTVLHYCVCQPWVYGRDFWVCAGWVFPWVHAHPWYGQDRGRHEHIWELRCGLWGSDTCPGLGLSLLSDVSLILSPSHLSPPAFLPAEEKGNLTHGFFLLLEGDTSVVVDIGDCGSSTLWTLSSLSFALSSLTAVNFAGTELDAPHHCGHAGLQQKE